MLSLQLQNKKGLVLGVANERSIAWHIAQTLHQAGAQIALTYLDERALRKVQPLVDLVQAPIAMACDVTQEQHMIDLFERITQEWGELDFIVHSLAYADIQDLKNPIQDCSQAGFLQAMNVSAYSLLRLVHHAQALLNPSASIVTMTYLGAEVAIAPYGIMGPVKAALESQVKYLASSLGEQQIRVNAISAGPIKTLAASAIPKFRTLLKETQQHTALRRGVTQQEVAQTVAFLVSDLSSGITAEVLHVDAGAHAVYHV